MCNTAPSVNFLRRECSLYVSQKLRIVFKVITSLADIHIFDVSQTVTE